MSEEALNNHGAVKPKDGNLYFAVLSWKGLFTCRAMSHAKPIILRYLCKEARPIVVTPHVKTFIYFCHATGLWDICEVSTGVKIASGGSITDAYNKCVEFLKEYLGHEELFFQQMTNIGPHTQHSDTTYSNAMEYLTAGEQDNPTLAMLRRKATLGKEQP